MAFGREVDHGNEIMLLEQLMNESGINDIAFYKFVIRHVLYVPKVLEIACISKLIEIDDLIPGIVIHEAPYYVRTDKACSSCYQNCFQVQNDYYVNFKNKQLPLSKKPFHYKRA